MVELYRTYIVKPSLFLCQEYDSHFAGTHAFRENMEQLLDTRQNFQILDLLGTCIFVDAMPPPLCFNDFTIVALLCTVLCWV